MFNSKFLCIILLLTSLVFSQYGQGRPGKGKSGGCEISGTIIESKTNKPIEYASISIITLDNTIQTGGITNSKGEFKIDGIKPGSYSAIIEVARIECRRIECLKLVG